MQINDFFTITISFVLYSLVHSLFSTQWMKDLYKQHLPGIFPYYRFLFSIFQTGLFIAMWIYIPKPSQVVWHVAGPIVYLFRFFQILSLAGLYFSFKSFSSFEFIGFSQIMRHHKRNENMQTDEKYQLNTDGMFAISRHPLYLFIIILFLFEPVMTQFKLFLLFWLIAYFYIGSFFEERRMIKVFGQEYIYYQQTVSRFIPYKWIKKKFQYKDD